MRARVTRNSTTLAARGRGHVLPGSRSSFPWPITIRRSAVIPRPVAGVVAKHPIDTRPFWQACARHEITAYTVIAGGGEPPVPLPHMLLADPALPLIVLTMMPG